MLSLNEFAHILRLLRGSWVDLTLNIPQDRPLRVGTLREVKDFLHCGDACARVRELECYNMERE